MVVSRQSFQTKIANPPFMFGFPDPVDQPRGQDLRGGREAPPPRPRRRHAFVRRGFGCFWISLSW